MKLSHVILLGTLALAACGKGQDNKPILEKDRQTLEQAKKVDSVEQQNTQQQNQAVDQQTQ
jgi:hypothetical protein